MQLTTEKLKAGWLHPRRVVRNVVASHFADARTTDSDVTAHAIRGAREFGWGRFLTWGHKFAALPLADEAALEWVCGEVERTDVDAPSEQLKGHLVRMLARAHISLVERHRSRLLALPGLQPRERQVLLTRLELAPCSPAEAWRRLEEHCRAATAGSTFADAKIPQTELLLEPLERAGNESIARVLDVLRTPPPGTEGDDSADWLTGLMITLAGRLRLEEAAPLIWDLMAVDWDWYFDEAEAALTSIGTPGVVRLVHNRYPEAEWSARLCGTILLARLRCAESAVAIEETLGSEDDDGLRGHLGMAAAAQFDDRLVPLARAVLDEDPEDLQRGDIRELLVAFSHLSGHELPERDDWEKAVDELDDRLSRLGEDDAPLPGAFFSALGEDENFFDEDLDLDDWPEDDEEDDEAPVHRGLRVGRNSACPCGSGKKYKRCCLRNAPG